MDKIRNIGKPIDVFLFGDADLYTELDTIPNEVQRGKSDISILRNAMNRVGELPSSNCLKSLLNLDKIGLRFGTGLASLIMVPLSIEILYNCGLVAGTYYYDNNNAGLLFSLIRYCVYSGVLELINNRLIRYTFNNDSLNFKYFNVIGYLCHSYGAVSAIRELRSSGVDS